MRPPGRWSLRSRLALTAAALTALGLLGANGVGLVLFESYLVGQVDDRLTQVARRAPTTNPEELLAIRTALSRINTANLPGIAANEFRLYIYDSAGQPQLVLPAAADSEPELPGVATLKRHAGQGPFTVPGNDGASWRIRVIQADSGAMTIGASSLRDVESIIRRLTAIDVAVTLTVLALLSLLSRALVGVGLRPLSRMEETAGDITAGDYSRRVTDVDPHTEPGRLGRAVNLMLDRVEQEINARKTSEGRMRQFLADASHELRTPLTSIRGFSELVRRGGSVDEALPRIEAEAARMGVLVDDLLLLARLDERRPVENTPVDLLALCAELVRDVHLRHPSRKVQLDPAGELFEPVVVQGDELRLRQVVRNLLDNAVRHTPEKAAITVRIGSAGPGLAMVEVADTGPGVAEKDAPYIFERLYRADRARSSDGGSGLGLAIAAAIVAAHGGRLELADTPGGGATFRVFLAIPSGL
jgi:two-component system OmpR family sensor kinase